MSIFKGAKKEYEVECVAEFAPPIGKVKFFATFRKLKRSEIVKLQLGPISNMLEQVGPDSSDRLLEMIEDIGNIQKQEEIINTVKENLISWREMHGEPQEGSDDDLVPYTPENAEVAFEVIEYALALSKGFMQVQVGSLQLQAKN